MVTTRSEELPVDRRYLEGVRARLDALFASAPVEDYDPGRDRIIVFSDHHRGVGDGADDFRFAEHAYATALGFYRESGYRLLLLGDVEELWEVTRPGRIFDHYEHLMALERDFVGRGGMDRFWGNHDDRWSKAGPASEELGPRIGGGPVREALKLNVGRPGRDPVSLFFVHGHQGTPESDRWGWLARLPVRYVWPLVQRWQGWTATTPARDHALRGKHDTALFAWARERPGRILIAGHTHRPVFARSMPDPPLARTVAELERERADAQRNGEREAAVPVAAELEYARTLERRPELKLQVWPPCYFNTGCCSFPDGDITGIEIADGELRLVRWPANLAELRPEGSQELDPGRRILVSEDLDTIANTVAEPPPESQVVERPLLPGEEPGSDSG